MRGRPDHESQYARENAISRASIGALVSLRKTGRVAEVVGLTTLIGDKALLRLRIGQREAWVQVADVELLGARYA